MPYFRQCEKLFAYDAVMWTQKNASLIKTTCARKNKYQAKFEKNK